MEFLALRRILRGYLQSSVLFKWTTSNLVIPGEGTCSLGPLSDLISRVFLPLKMLIANLMWLLNNAVAAALSYSPFCSSL